MSEAAARGPSRRMVLASAGLLAVVGCVPPSESPRPPVDREDRTRARIAEEVRTLGRLYTAVVTAFPDADPMLTAFAAEHRAHARALAGPLPEVTTPGTGPESPTTGPAEPDGPSGLAAALQSLVAAEQAAARRRSRQAGRASPALARLLASIAGCEAAHAALLPGSAGA